jgi:hypothetical protein
MVRNGMSGDWDYEDYDDRPLRKVERHPSRPFRYQGLIDDV